MKKKLQQLSWCRRGWTDVCVFWRKAGWMCERVWADDTCGDGAAGGDALGKDICQEDHQTCRTEKNTFVSCSAQVPSWARLKEQAQRVSVSVSVSVLPVFSLVLLRVSVLTRWRRLRWASPCLHQLNTADAHIPACRTVRPEYSGPDSGSWGPGLGWITSSFLILIMYH